MKSPAEFTREWEEFHRSRNQEASAAKLINARAQKLGLSQDHLALVLGVATRTVRRWEDGESPVPGMAWGYILAILKYPALRRELGLELTNTSAAPLQAASGAGPGIPRNPA